MSGSSKQIDVRKAAGILIRDRKLLVVRQKGRDYFISPGGKPNGQESLEETLLRELREETGLIVQVRDLEHFGTFYAPAESYPDNMLEMSVYLVKKWAGELRTNNEDQVEEQRWITSADLRQIRLGSIFEHEVIPRLIKMKLID